MIKFSVILISLALFLISLIYIGFFNNECNSGDLSIGANIATIMATSIALITLPFIYIQIRDNKIQQKRERSYNFTGKYHTPDYLDFIGKTRLFLNNTPKEQQMLKFDNDFEIRKNVVATFSYFEETATMYNMDLIDKEIVKLTLKLPIIFYFDLGKDLIYAMRRVAKSEEVYNQWETLHDNLKCN